MLANLPADTRIPAYLRRLFLTGDPVGKDLFRRWLAMTVAMTEQLIAAGVMQPVEDIQARAAFLLCNDLADDPLPARTSSTRWTSTHSHPKAYIAGPEPHSTPTRAASLERRRND